MKKFNLLLLIGCLVCLGAFPAFAAETMSVQVKEGHVRAEPFFLGKIITVLAYGERVVVHEKRDGWLRVESFTTHIKGWLHSSAVTDKKIILSAGDKDVRQSATSDEVALAGKGFNKQVEAEYKKRNQKMDYTWIDRMSHMSVSPEQISDFLKKGELLH